MITSANIDFIVRYVNKHVDDLDILMELDKLAEAAHQLLKDNFLLKANLLDIESAVEPDHQWENILACKLARAVQTKGEVLELTQSVNNETWIITIHKKFGRTPLQLLEDSEIRRKKAQQKAKSLLKENQHMQGKLSMLDREICAIRLLKNSAELEQVQRQQVGEAIKVVNSWINQLNNNLYRQSMAKLHTSVRDSYFEAWQQVSLEAHKRSIVEKELKELKKTFNQRETVRSKFGKYRRASRKKGP
jgi:hypothetical protein